MQPWRGCGKVSGLGWVAKTPSTLIAILALGAVTRIPSLSVQSFFSDEGFTAEIATAHASSAASQIPHTESTPPLYYALAWVWAHVFGASEFALRFPSAMFGCLTVAAIYWVGVALSTRRVALIASALTAVSPLMVWYSQEARAYALFALLSVLALGFFIRALAEPRREWLTGWAVCSAAALATHYFALFSFSAEAAWLVLRARARRQMLLPLTLPVLVCAVLAPLALYQRSHVPRWWTSAFTVADQVKAITQSFLVGITWSPLTHRVGVAVLGSLALTAAVAVVRRGSPMERRGGLGLTLLVVVTLAIPTIISLGKANYLAPRNVLYVWPALALIIAIGAGGQNAGRVSAASLAAGCAVSLSIVAAVPIATGLQRDNWRSLLQALKPDGSTRALVVSDGFNDVPVIRYYVHGLYRPERPTHVQEVDVVTDVRNQAAHATQFLPVAGLSLISRELRGELALSRFTSTGPILMPTSAPAGSGESILVEGHVTTSPTSSTARRDRRLSPPG